MLYDKFIECLRGDMNSTRKECVKNIWNFFAKGNDTINAADLRARYNCSSHPGVVAGTIT
jgi:hypothetical protein